MKILIIVANRSGYRDYEQVVREQSARECAKDIEFELLHITGTSDDILLNNDADIIVARGITALAVRDNCPGKILKEIEITGYDVLRSLDVCRDSIGAGRVAVLLTEDIYCDSEILQHFMDFQITVYRVRTEEDIYAVIEDGMTKGIQAFIGGTTCYDICKKMNVRCFPFSSSIGSIRSAVRAAVDAAESISRERSKITLLQRLLSSTRDAMIAVDSGSRILVVNRKAEKWFGIEAAVGQKISGLLPDLDALADEEQTEEPILFNYKEHLYVVSRAAMYEEQTLTGYLYTIQNSEGLVEAEKKIRKELKNRGLTAKYVFEDILGESQGIRETVAMARKYSRVDSNVLIVGETGTGKELIAHSIHNASRRRNQPFVAVNCAALPENLLESELFGYVEGAFSGASRGGKTGLFELAHKGTIFLDEIGEIPIALQAKLLRVLQEKEVRRVGGDRVIPVDVRVISATNINIQDKIEAGKFRSDLYYRLNLLDVRLEPLRERKEDIPVLMRSFIWKCAEEMGKRNVRVEEEAIRQMQEYDWPGNIRELSNICERLVVLDESGAITAGDVRAALGRRGTRPSGKTEELEPEPESAELETLYENLLRLGIKKSQAAELLGVSRTTLWRKMNKKS